MLLIAATPIGNLQDTSARLRDAFMQADLIAAEDTRKTKQLIKLLEVRVSAKFVALHEHNERDTADRLAAEAAEKTVLLVSDAGMPTVSDPGFRVVAAAVARDVTVSVIPGPSAALAALAIAGIPTDRFAFEGFLPRKEGQLRQLLNKLSAEERTLIFFESPQRIYKSLQCLESVFGAARQAAICREITKLHEEVLRGSLGELAERVREPLRGEIVLVVAGAKSQALSAGEALQVVLDRVRQGERLKDAAREVATVSGVSARKLYDLATAHKSQ